MQRPAPQDIARRAYELWERGGRIHGQDQQYWFKAERELIGAATAAEDRPIGEVRGAEPASPPVLPSASQAPVPAAQPATAEQDRPIGEIRQAQQTSAKPAAPVESDPVIKASRRAGVSAEADDLAAQIAELQRLMTKSKPVVKPAAKPRAKKQTGEANDPAGRYRK